MSLPTTDHATPFDITRASHLELVVGDLEESLRFYTRLAGLVVTERVGDVAYLRGLEESCHHSLVLRAGASPCCSYLGFRVWDEDQLSRLFDELASRDLAPEWVEREFQGRTFAVSDPGGVPLEFCSRMPVQERLVVTMTRHTGGAAHRLDHFQLHVPEVRAGAEFYTSLGFRLSEYLTPDDETLLAVFLQRKGNPHDIVLFEGPGPRFHHFAFTTPDVTSLLTACDTAAELGYGPQVERGPGRHGPGHALFTYFRDPDGHRVELFTTHYQTMDIDDEPVRWDVRDPTFGTPWGLPAQRTWHEEASLFAGVGVETPTVSGSLPTLEKYLAEKA